MIGYKVPRSQGIRLDANESSKNLPEWMMEEILQELPHLEFNRYPDDQYQPLRQAYARLFGLQADQVLVGTGSDQMLMLLISRFIEPGGVLALIDPDFGMYGFYDALFHGLVDAWPIELDKGIDLEAWIAHILEIQPELVLFSNPHNPSGRMLSSSQIARLASAIDPIPLCVDEAYMEFGRDSAIELIASHPNLYITRTLSKAYRLAGIRVGFLLSQAQNIRDLLPYKIVYNVSSLSSTVATIALRHAGWFAAKSEQLIRRREAMMDFLRTCRYLKPLESQANFICIVSDHIDELKKAFEQARISVRTFENKNYLRLSIGEAEEMMQVRRAIQAFENRMEAMHETGSD